MKATLAPAHTIFGPGPVLHHHSTQLENDLVAWVPHAQEVRCQSETVLVLESRIIDLQEDVGWLREGFTRGRKLYPRLEVRCAVRFGLCTVRRLRSFFPKALWSHFPPGAATVSAVGVKNRSVPKS